MGFPLQRAQGCGQGHSHPHTHQRSLVWRGGALPRRCPGAGIPCTKDCDSQSHRGPNGTEVLELEGLGNRAGALGCGILVRINTHSLQAFGTPVGPTVEPQEGTRAEALRPSPSLIPKYFPLSRSSEDRKIPRAAGSAQPRPRPRPSHQRSLMAQTLPRSWAAGLGPTRPAAQMPALHARPHAGTRQPARAGGQGIGKWVGLVPSREWRGRRKG